MPTRQLTLDTELKLESRTKLVKTTSQLQTTAQVWSLLREQGISARHWALENGFDPTLVYSVLSGTRKCLRGKSHDVAKALGIK